MDFARKHLSKHGWTDGQGLGKDEEGITEAIKVKIKQDKKGVGHNPGEEFSFHWWDHVFNKAASKIEVSRTEDGVQIKNSGDTKVSKTKNSKTYDNKAMLYGQFVKGSTLSNGLETREATLEESSDEEPGEETQCLMPDQAEVVFKMCGGRTAHKGARHGLKANGKLLRIQEQEKLLLEQYNSKSANQKDRDMSCDHVNGQVNDSNEMNENKVENETLKKSKKKKRKHQDNDVNTDAINDGTVDEIENESKIIESKSTEDCSKPKKKKKSKKSKKRTDMENVEIQDDVIDGNNDDIPDSGVGDDIDSKAVENDLADNNDGRSIKKLKKKKKKKQRDI
ncbi:G patch domain-containing protein 4-like [Ruditapes philippinarum]|uniref:G patch domain-containing protein 4-like n=1 Tax=Ruditapes philippinarum TaxID=129788 RepID=UPI00295A6B37|nr:G patch domain-containing protein 4-like [Ruditapes philippinarum]